MSWIWLGPPAVIAFGAWAVYTLARRIERRAGDVDAAVVGLNAHREALSEADTELRATAARLPETRR